VSAGITLDLERFVRLFLEEAAEQLGTLESGLLRLETEPDNREILDAVFRAAHSIKGGSSTFGLHEVARLTHHMESLLERMRSGHVQITPALSSLLLRATDGLRELLGATQEGRAAAAPADLLAELERTLGVPGAATVQAPSQAGLAPDVAGPTLHQIRFRPDPEIYGSGLDPLLVLRELAEAGEIVETRADLSALPALADLDPERSYLAWKLRLRSTQTPVQLRDIFAFVGDDSEVAINPEAAAVSASAEPASQSAVAESRGRSQGVESSTIRVAIDKVDKLIDLVGELVIAQSMISQVVKTFSPDQLTRLQESVGEMERNIRELQERVMAVRMVPLSTVFSRFPRLVRDLSSTLGKKVTVEIAGGETEIDRGVIECIGDPLTHLVRNAIDHGIETPAQRLAAGKPERGTIKLSAFHQGGNVVIHVEDDGRGLDLQRIKAKAVAVGLIGPDENPPPEALHGLIFGAGFSTAERVTDISGRGVGMDVVRTNIESLNGTISLNSQPGRGARVCISLPLTLAIIDGLCVGLGEEAYVIPLVSIVESFRARASDIRTIVGRGEVVTVRGQILPLVRLRRLLAVPARKEPTSDGIVVIVEHQDATVGLLVDDIQGQAQVVIKSLETHYRRVEGVMGATIMGDGRVALILDIQGLTRLGHTPRVSAAERRIEA
jgi:two-component system, chemotaxis family, sensor kinase CheA